MLFYVKNQGNLSGANMFSNIMEFTPLNLIDKAKILALISSLVLTLYACNQSNEAKADKYYRQEKTEEAIKYYDLAIKEGNTEAMNKLALLYSNMHKPEKAKEYYKMSAERGNVEAAKMLGAISFSEGNYEAAIRYYKPFGDKGEREVAYNLGSACLKLKRYAEAEKYLRLDAGSVYTMDILGQLYYEKGDSVKAEKYWKTAVDNFASGAVNSYHKLLELYKQQGREADYNAYYGKY